MKQNISDNKYLLTNKYLLEGEFWLEDEEDKKFKGIIEYGDEKGIILTLKLNNNLKILCDESNRFLEVGKILSYINYSAEKYKKINVNSNIPTNIVLFFGKLDNGDDIIIQGSVLKNDKNNSYKRSEITNNGELTYLCDEVFLGKNMPQYLYFIELELAYINIDNFFNISNGKLETHFWLKKYPGDKFTLTICAETKTIKITFQDSLGKLCPADEFLAIRNNIFVPLMTDLLQMPIFEKNMVFTTENGDKVYHLDSGYAHGSGYNGRYYGLYKNTDIYKIPTDRNHIKFDRFKEIGFNNLLNRYVQYTQTKPILKRTLEYFAKHPLGSDNFMGDYLMIIACIEAIAPDKKRKYDSFFKKYKEDLLSNNGFEQLFGMKYCLEKYSPEDVVKKIPLYIGSIRNALAHSKAHEEIEKDKNLNEKEIQMISDLSIDFINRETTLREIYKLLYMFVKKNFYQSVGFKLKPIVYMQISEYNHYLYGNAKVGDKLV